MVTDIEQNPWLHRIALLTVACTFPLIFMGGLVTSHQAGMSVPDWPNSYGYNMFLFPPRLWIGGILYEHTHRLMASVVGFVSIVLTIVAWRIEPRRWVRWLATSVLGAVIFQGVLGGLRVVLVKLDLAIVHACFAQAFFCLTVLVAVVTSQWWMNAPDLSKSNGAAKGRRVIAAAVTAVLIVYGQLMIGAVMRHYKAGLAIPDLPLVYGKLLPPTTQDRLNEINQLRVFHPDSFWAGRIGEDHLNKTVTLEPVTLAQVWLHFGHRVGAIVVSVTLITLAGLILTASCSMAGVVAAAWTLLALLFAQVTLGILTVYLGKPADVASTHVAVGALVLATTFFIAVRTMRLYSLRFRKSASGFTLQNPAALEPLAAAGL